MRTYSELTEEEQGKAREIALTDVLTAILERGLRFSDKLNHDNLQARIDKAIAKADKMQTPWFAHEYILDTCRDELEGMAASDAEDALYPDSSESIIRLIDA
jgi:hypothetical protein